MNSLDDGKDSAAPAEPPGQKRKPGPVGFHLVRRWAIILLVPYGLVIVALMLGESYLVYPVLLGGKTDQPFSLPEVRRGYLERLTLETADHVSIDSIHYCPFASPDESRGIFLFCHGNGEWIQPMIPFLIAMGDRHRASVMCFDYRGYGQSDGFPNEQGILKDADAAYQAILDLGYPAEHIIVFGRSIGGGPACYLAGQHEIGGLILQNTFSSLVEVASDRFFWLPVTWIMRNRFDSASRLERFQGPLLQSHGTNDRVVPFDLGKKLFDAAGSDPDNKEFVAVEGGGHSDPISDAVHRKIKRFVDRILKPERK